MIGTSDDGKCQRKIRMMSDDDDLSSMSLALTVAMASSISSERS
jgi:hypothetical protein